jgi:hypothetical protein
VRCYNGCPDSALQAVLDSRSRAHDALAQMGARATWYPVEQKYMVFVGIKPLTWDMFGTVEAAAAYAAKQL